MLLIPGLDKNEIKSIFRCLYSLYSKQTQNKLKTNSKQTQNKLKTNSKQTQNKLKTNSKQTQNKLKTNSKQQHDDNSSYQPLQYYRRRT